MELTEAELSFVNACLREQEERKLYKTAYVKPKYGVHDFCSDSENVLKTALLRGLNFRSDSLFLRSLVKRIMFLARKWEFRERKENAIAEQLRVACFGGVSNGIKIHRMDLAKELIHVTAEFRMLTPSQKTGHVVMTDPLFAQAMRYQNAFKQIRKLRAMAKDAMLQTKRTDELRKKALESRHQEQPVIMPVDMSLGWNRNGRASRFNTPKYVNKSSGGGYW
jgi:hypothetical protein